MTTEKTAKSQRAKLRAVAKNYEEAVRKIEAFKAKHLKVFEKFAELSVEAEDLQAELKELAREIANDESTETLIDSPTFWLEVRPTHTQPVFSVAKARKYWPEEVFSQCRKTIIDNAEVTQAAKAGLITEKLLEKAVSEPPELRSKAVYVKVKEVS